jgi:iron complex outermembrane recepter protein
MNHHIIILRRGVIAAAALHALGTSATAHAQSAAASQPAASAPVQSVVITGNPLGSDVTATATTVLTGDPLVLRRGSSLGETLDGLPGVSSSYFGPNANRPIIRGQDGDRIRVLSNAGASLDASSLSYDHAVPIDPLVVERIEVLRGPQALLYGGSATGGVVNAIDNRIPKSPLSGVSGAAEARFGGAANERGFSGLVEAGGNGLALHADAFHRTTDDLRVPDFDRPLEDGTTERRNRIADSASQAKGGAVGGSAVWAHGYFGAAVDTYRNNYGAVAEEGVVIHMKRDKVALAGEVRDLAGPFTTLRLQAGSTDYQHQEVEASGEVGTTFKNKGVDYRVEALHARASLGGGELAGVVGLQGENSSFEALGEEGFVPKTHTGQVAAFVLEQWQAAPSLQLSAGLRYESDHVKSDGDADAEEPRFGPASKRSFSPANASIGGALQIDKEWKLNVSAAHTERAPVSYEIYANGIHAATGTYERGNLDQAKERGNNLDAGLEWRRGENHVKVGAFVSRFSNYIALVPTGEPPAEDAGETFPVYEFRGVSARLHGGEAEAQARVLDAGSKLDLDGRVDFVRGDNRSTGEPLPRIAPVRVAVGATWQLAAFSTRLEVQHADRQSRVPSDDMATPGYTLVNLSASYKLRLGGADGLLFAKLTNLGNQLAYNATTIETVRPLSPLGGRAASAGLRIAF